MDPTIVLLHGAFADASGFRPLYDELLGTADRSEVVMTAVRACAVQPA